MKRVVFAVGLLLPMLGVSQAAEVNLRVLETTDLHMNLLSYDYYQDKETDQYGLARTITLIKAARQEAANCLLFDNGDLLQGSPMGDLVARIKPLATWQIHPAFKVMNQLGYDAANVGNHDFNFGLPFLQRSLLGAGFPYVSANVFVDDAGKDTANPTNAFIPYVLLDRTLKDAQGGAHVIKIGVIGFVPPQIMQWDKTNLEGRVVTRDMMEMAQKYVPEMRAKGAQLVIALAHSGFEKGEVPAFAENSVSRLADVPGIDAILFGHAHAEFPSKTFASYPKVDVERGTINGVASVMPGRWGDHLGVIDFTLDNSGGVWKVKTSQSSIRPIFDKIAKKSLAAPDPAVAITIADEHAQTLSYVRGKVAVSSAPIYSYFAQVGDDPSVQIVSNAQIRYVKRAMQGTEYEKYPILSAAAPFKSGGRQGWSYYTDIPAGPLAIKNVADLYIYPNTLKAMLLTGSDVREWLEMSAGQFNQIDPKGEPRQDLINAAFPSYNFDTIDGVTYEIDVTQPARYSIKGELVSPQSHRIQNLKFKGALLVATDKFVVATNNYRAFGGGNFPGLNASKVILDAPDENREALVQYLSESETQGPGKALNPSADGNWRILPVNGVKLGFMTSVEARKYVSNHPSIRFVKDLGDGSALFELAE